ncbi:MAG: hypothetical protein P4M08_08700 [Oligoflexia bacterium]|nr:hypothetical protein [Oligoflexia bacterium]
MTRKNMITLMSAAIVFTLWAAWPNASFAQTGAETGVDGTNIRHSGGRRMRINDKRSNDTSLIQGSCTVVQSDSNPIAGPCVNVMLSLVDMNGTEVSQARTDGKGHFEFIAQDPNAQYHLIPKSKSYQLIGAQPPLKAGMKLSIQLKIL